ncbi:prepilin peptidase [Bacillus coahuilensis m2-6]|uniref:prepilin peptidase n=1 Tax=Bacillus coahuilensis TaxID=408580 RepID=UPI0007504B9C|nr:A24 family peptidase [Bacillus coahuilensis]KUP06971.1 prepilin peptidase [Bacillus coahuilensis m2-6]
MIHILFFLYGTIFGSFYNVVGLRIPVGQSIVRPRSSCPTCSHELTAKELIPVLSYVIQGGKCRQCQAGISLFYPIMELLTGLLFLVTYIHFGFSPNLIIGLTLCSLFIIITVSDLKYMIISDRVLLFFASVLFIERLIFPLTPWWSSFLGAVVGFLLLLIISVVSRGGMGGGDIKLYAVIGLALGVKLTLLSFFLATLVGTVVGVIGMIMGMVHKGKPMPFGPFIAIGSLLAFFYGNELILWYLDLFL